MMRRDNFVFTRLLRACAFVFLAGALPGVAFAQGAQQGSQAPPSLRQSGPSNGSSQSSPSPAPSLQGGSGQSAGASAAGPAAQAQPQPTIAETQAYDALQKEIDPDKQIQMVKDFVQKYPNSQWLSDVYFFGASASEQKNDVASALDLGQKSLKLQPNNLRSLILVSGLLPLPQALPPNAVQRQQQLNESENDAARALQLLATAQPQAGVPPSQFNQTKSAIEAQLHSALGMAHLEESTMVATQPVPPTVAEAEKEAHTDVVLPRPLRFCVKGLEDESQYRLDDAISDFTQAAQAGQEADIQTYANTVVQQLNAEKSELAMAEQEFKTVTANPQSSAQDFYRLGEVYTRENKLDDAISAFTQAGQHAPGTLIQKYADQMVQQAQALKVKNPQPQNSSPAAAASGKAPASAPSGSAPASATAPTSQPAKQ